MGPPLKASSAFAGWLLRCSRGHAALAMPQAAGDAQTYCVALLNQEKSLEELQQHLHKTEARAPPVASAHVITLITARVVCRISSASL